MRSGIPFAVFVASGALAACTLLVESSGLSGGGPKDASAGDASGQNGFDGAPADIPTDGAITDSASSDASTDAGLDGSGRSPNLLTNADFELGCAGWSDFRTSSASTNDSRSGASACRVCVLGHFANGDWALYQRLKTRPPAGTPMLFEAWVRRAPLSDAGPTNIDGTVYNGNGISIARQSVAVTDDWQRVSVLFAFPASNPDLDLAVGQQAVLTKVPDGTCYLVDDVYLGVVE